VTRSEAVQYNVTGQRQYNKTLQGQQQYNKT